MMKQPVASKSARRLCSQDTVGQSVDPFSHNKRLGAFRRDCASHSKISNSAEMFPWGRHLFLTFP